MKRSTLKARPYSLNIAFQTIDLIRCRRWQLISFAANAPLLLPAATQQPSRPRLRRRRFPSYSTGDDPINIGLVESLARPGGNVTGVFFYAGGDLEFKHLELLREVAPKTAVVGVLINPVSAEAKFQLRRAQIAAGALGLQFLILNASSERDFDMVFATLPQQQAAAAIAGDALFTGELNRLVALTVRQRIPAIYNQREFAAAGGLMSYGASITEAYRDVGVYTSKILKGAKPAELPVLQPTKFELVINLRTAKALGIDVPWFLQQRADEVIE